MTVNASTDGEGEEPEDTGEVGLSTDTRGFGANASISGQINEDEEFFIASDSSGIPYIYVGDTASRLKVQGFLSFDVSEIAGENVLNAWLNINGSRIGDPNSLLGVFSVSSTNYGNTLYGRDFGVSTSTLFSQPLSYSDFSFTNEDLKNAVQDILASDRQYFQVKLGTNNVNVNGVSDGFTFLLSNISLGVSYN